MTLSKKQRELLRNKFGGKCAYCGSELPEKGWHADHFEALERQSKLVKVGGVHGSYKYVQTGVCSNPAADRLENLVPSCRACNIDKSNLSLEDWRGYMERRVAICRDNYSAFRHAERFGLIIEVKQPVVFWFEKFGGSDSKQCNP